MKFMSNEFCCNYSGCSNYTETLYKISTEIEKNLFKNEEVVYCNKCNTISTIVRTSKLKITYLVMYDNAIKEEWQNVDLKYSNVDVTKGLKYLKDAYFRYKSAEDLHDYFNFDLYENLCNKHNIKINI